jgi:hypothetical protein
MSLSRCVHIWAYSLLHTFALLDVERAERCCAVAKRVGFCKQEGIVRYDILGMIDAEMVGFKTRTSEFNDLLEKAGAYVQIANTYDYSYCSVDLFCGARYTLYCLCGTG